MPTENIAALRIISQAGLDAASPLAFTLPITRSKGIVYPERIARNVDVSYRLPADFIRRRKATMPRGAARGRTARLSCCFCWPGWRCWPAHWRGRTPGARWPPICVVSPSVPGVYDRLYRLLRAGQLSIVNITGVIQALLRGAAWAFSCSIR
ncbi:hypothetical protein [Janthinobacterium lividum]|uniref:hypothetical protein n=1 Tax=Janthinobacterium lividum TaxID=29581 RepID=UPI0020925817|nr:hypothetical protein [Janthinobacterium lividum]